MCAMNKPQWVGLMVCSSRYRHETEIRRVHAQSGPSRHLRRQQTSEQRRRQRQQQEQLLQPRRRRQKQSEIATATAWRQDYRLSESIKGWSKKVRPQTRAIILWNLNGFTNKKFAGKFLSKFAVNWLLKIPPPRAYVATLPCETLMSENKRLTTNYKVV